MSAKDPRQVFIAGSLAGTLAAGAYDGQEQIAETVRVALDNPENLQAVEAELSEAEERMAAAEPGSATFMQNERVVRLLRNVLALRRPA